MFNNLHRTIFDWSKNDEMVEAAFVGVVKKEEVIYLI